MVPELPREPTYDPDAPMQPAGFVTRLVAFLIDQIIIGMVLAILTSVVGIMFQSFRLGPLLGIGDVTLRLLLIPLGAAGFVLGLFYYVGFWLLAGQTPGKAALGVAVIRADGSPLRPWAAIVRWLGYWLSGILFLGFLSILVDNRRQAFHDKLAGTLVVHRELDERGPSLSDQMRERLRDRQMRKGAAGIAGPPHPEE